MIVYYVRFDAGLMVEVEHEGDDHPSERELRKAVEDAMRAGNVAENIEVYEAEPQR